MSLAKVRLKMLERMAQAAGVTTPPTSENIAVPTDPSPLASSLYSYLRIGFDPARVTIIENLMKTLSLAANVATNGKYNLQTLKNQNFQFDPSSFNSTDQKNLMGFFLKVYKTILNNGVPFTAPVTADRMQFIIPFLLQSPELNNLSQVSPTGQIAQKTQVSGSFKDAIRNLVTRLQPTVPTRPA